MRANDKHDYGNETDHICHWPTLPSKTISLAKMWWLYEGYIYTQMNMYGMCDNVAA